MTARGADGRFVGGGGGGGASGGSVIDELWVALGLDASGVQSGLAKVRGSVDGAKESLLSVGTAIKAFVAGFAVKEIADIGSYFEQARIDIAGFYNALGMSSDFNAGLTQADDTMQSIVAAAAAMPGEANDYIQVFKAGLPFVREALGKNSKASDITAFTNKLTGTMISPEMPASTIGSEMEMLLAGQGRARNTLPLFMKLSVLMRSLPGQAHLTAQSFNQMSQAARFDLIDKSLDKMGPALEAKKHTFDAIFGAIKSDIKMITLSTTKPMFEGMKKGLDAINNAIYGEGGKLTPFGQNIVDGITTAMKYLTQMLAMGGHLIMWFAQAKAGALAFKGTLALLGAALAGLAVEKTVGSFTKLLGVLTNMTSLLRGTGAVALGLIAEDLYQFATGGESVTGVLVDKLGPALTIIIGSIGTLIALNLALRAAAVATGLRIALSMALAFWPVTLAIIAIGALAFGIYELKQHWAEVFDWIGKKWDWVVDKIHAAKEALGISTDYQGAGAADGATTDPMTDAVIPASGGAPWAPADGAGGGGAWTPAAAAGGAAAGAGAAGATSNTTNHNTFNIKSTDPVQAGNEAARALARNAQTAVKY